MSSSIYWSGHQAQRYEVFCPSSSSLLLWSSNPSNYCDQLYHFSLKKKKSKAMTIHLLLLVCTRFQYWGFPGGASGKEPSCQCRRCKRCKLDFWVGMIPWRRRWQPTLVFLPGESHGQGVLGATVHGVTKSQIWLKWLSRVSNTA